MFFYLFICFTLLFISSSSQAINNALCKTPDNRNGECVNIYDCQPLLDLIQSFPRPVSEANKQKVKQFKCNGGGEGEGKGGKMVCCPKLSLHPNYNLLNHASCGRIVEDRLIGGNLTQLGEYPHMALLKYANTNEFRCTGTIINEQYILTLTSCLKTTNTLIGVRLGEFNLNTDPDCDSLLEEKICLDPAVDVEIEEIVVHENYQNNHFNDDIGLIRLKEKINLNQDLIQSICLPVYGIDENAGRKWYTSYGWGLIDKDAPKDGLYRVYQFHELSNNDCKLILNNDRMIEANIGCVNTTALNEIKMIDSGAPLMRVQLVNHEARATQYGINLIVRTDNKQPNLFLNVEKYTEWILNHLRA